MPYGCRKGGCQHENTMGTFWIVISCVLWALSIFLLFRKQLLAPAASYLGLLALSMADNAQGEPLLPINNTMLIGWLCITLVSMTATILQPYAIREQKRGVAYMLVGAVTGLFLGLLDYTIQLDISARYGMMIIATAVGAFFGYLIFTCTPNGKNVNFGSGNFFRYLLAKGFPVAITVMMMGIVLVILNAMYNG